VERLQPFSLPAHKSTTLRQSVKVSSTETGVIYGAVTYDLASSRGGGLAPPDLRTVSINLADIHMDVMEYVYYVFQYQFIIVSNCSQLHKARSVQRRRVQEDVERIRVGK
jgi:coatomer subunit beta